MKRLLVLQSFLAVVLLLGVAFYVSRVVNQYPIDLDFRNNGIGSLKPETVDTLTVSKAALTSLTLPRVAEIPARLDLLSRELATELVYQYLELLAGTCRMHPDHRALLRRELVLVLLDERPPLVAVLDGTQALRATTARKAAAQADSNDGTRVSNEITNVHGRSRLR